MSIEMTDNTVIESYGNFENIKSLMEVKEWMLITYCFIFTDLVQSTFLLHLYSDGIVRIISTDRPLELNYPDNDLRELWQWCDRNGWKALEVASSLIDDYRGFQFWFRQYMAGNIKGSAFEKYENERLLRSQKETHHEKMMENANVNYSEIKEH